MPNQQSSAIAVLGAGSWGTALACHLANNQNTVYLWGNNPTEIELMRASRRNQKYLPEIIFPENLHPSSDMAEVLQHCKNILIAVPSHAFRAVLEEIKHYQIPQQLVWATKGLDPTSHRLLHEVSQEILGDIPIAVLSGPSFAKETAKGLPTAVVIATTEKKFADELQTKFHSKTFRVYSSDDVIGVELGGAMKNVLAIAVGIADGLGYGANARSALITRGLAEMMRLGLAFGAKPETFMGLSGVGDLILTCTDNQSRNRRLGLALGQGISIANAQKEIGQVVEGIRTAAEIYHLIQDKKVAAPICEQVYQVIHHGLAPEAAVENLLTREAKAE